MFRMTSTVYVSDNEAIFVATNYNGMFYKNWKHFLNSKFGVDFFIGNNILKVRESKLKGMEKQ